MNGVQPGPHTHAARATGLSSVLEEVKKAPSQKDTHPAFKDYQKRSSSNQ